MSYHWEYRSSRCTACLLIATPLLVVFYLLVLRALVVY